MSQENLTNKLNRFSDLISDKKKPRSQPQSGAPKHYKFLAEELGGELIDLRSGSVCRIITRYQKHNLHGTNHEIEFDSDTTVPLAAFSTKADDRILPTTNLLFFDTETTGLGGAGAVAFLVGFGSLVGDVFEVRQYIIPDYSDEAALMELLLDEFSEQKSLVSFNGAAFDVPLVRDRMIINRAAREVACHHHLDLLHPARRIYRRRLSSCTLVNLEKELLGFQRQDDIPGYLIPAVYFDWLSERKSDGLKNVMEHNRLDIVSMYYLLIMLGEAYETLGESLGNVDDLHSLARLYDRHKRRDDAVTVCDRLAHESPANIAPDILFFQGMTLKRTGRIDEAVEVWLKIAGSANKVSVLAAIELAKLYEHKYKNYESALTYSLLAADNHQATSRSTELINRRIERLHKKLSL